MDYDKEAEIDGVASRRLGCRRNEESGNCGLRREEREKDEESEKKKESERAREGYRCSIHFFMNCRIHQEFPLKFRSHTATLVY